jgi:hypothetical protein
MIQWNDGRRGQDGWDRYTRRRKWYRDAELAELSPSGTENTTEETVSGLTQALEKEKQQECDEDAETKSIAPSTASKTRRRRWFSSSKEKEKDQPASPIESGRASG